MIIYRTKYPLLGEGAPVRTLGRVWDGGRTDTGISLLRCTVCQLTARIPHQSPPCGGDSFSVCGAQNFLFADRSRNFDRCTHFCPASSATGGAGQRGPGRSYGRYAKRSFTTAVTIPGKERHKRQAEVLVRNGCGH